MHVCVYVCKAADGVFSLDFATPNAMPLWLLSVGLSSLDSTFLLRRLFVFPFSWLLALPLIMLMIPVALFVASCLLFLLPALVGLHVLVLPISLVMVFPAFLRQSFISGNRSWETPLVVNITSSTERPFKKDPCARRFKLLPTRAG